MSFQMFWLGLGSATYSWWVNLSVELCMMNGSWLKG